MPPKTNSIDGVSKSTLAPSMPATTPPINQNNNQQSAPTPNTTSKNKARSPYNSSPTGIVLVTIVVMILLISLAYFAYHKSRYS